MGGWAAELASGEASEGRPYDSADLSWVLSTIDEHAPTQLVAEFDWAECEAQRIVSANLDRVERLADELIKREELSDADEILAIFKLAR
jgi:hypothetical protein